MAFVYNNAKELFLNGGIDFDNDAIRLLLVNSNYAADPDHNFVNEGSGAANPVANELSGPGYTRKLLATSVVEDDANNRARLHASNVSWPSINAGTAHAAIIYMDTGADTTSPLIAYIDSGGFPQPTNGGALDINWHVDGIATLS